ncbi:MAG: vWA domain-containing protein [Candidatus Thorarchaeota archaeon]|jgi:Ca-activated chloride channel family protein
MKQKNQVAMLLVLVFFVSIMLRIPIQDDYNPTSELLRSSPSFNISEGGELDPTSVAVEGQIIDNYANFSYSMVFDNTASSEAREVNWLFGLQEGVRLSNISVVLPEMVLWGRAMPELEAVVLYNVSVQHNETAVLVIRSYEGYTVSFNVENGTEAELTVYVEGLLTRHLGVYSLELPIAQEMMVTADFSLSMSIISHYGPIAGYSIMGISNFDVTSISDGVLLQYTCTQFNIPQELALTYALDRQASGSQIITHNNGTDQFFVYMLAPSITEVEERANRQFVFVLDISGSMSGTKIEQAKTAFSAMIGDLTSQDLFNVVVFSTDVRTLWLEAHTASDTNVLTAQQWVSNLDAGGSTNFHDACMTGLSTVSEGENIKVMLVLSDGRPTAGPIQNREDLISAISEANSKNVSISTVAFGSDADETLMANIAAQNYGYFALIESSEDAASKLLDFYKEVSTPIAYSYSICIEGGLDIACLQSLGDSPFFNGSEVVISGRFSSSMRIETVVNYVTGTETYHNTALSSFSDNKHVELLWAQQMISHLLEEVRLEGESTSLRNEIVDLALRYGIIVEGYTAIILTTYEQDSDSDFHIDTPYPTYPPPQATHPPVADYTFALGFGLLPAFGVGAIVIAMILLKKRRQV